jgi:AraC-like DNA-binding protein
VLRGQGTLYDENGDKYDLEGGMCFKRIPGKPESLSITDNSNWVEYFFEIGPSLYQALRSMRIIDPKPLCENICIDADFFTELIRHKERFKSIDERALPLIVGDFARLLAECRQRCNRPGQDKGNILIDRACDFLSSDFNGDCDLKGFCRKQGIGYESFRKVFKRQIGLSPWQYRIRRRLDLACALLRNPEMRINEISHELGYVSPYDFSAQFKKIFEISPSQFRSGASFKK